MPKVIALIPARYAATRFPGKLLKELDGKSIIRRTYEAVKNTQLFDQVIVVCDHESIRLEIEQAGGDIFMSQKEHESGTDRIAEAAAELEADILVNIQGDEPFISAEGLEKVIRLFDNPDVDIASLMMPIHDEASINNPNCVKVVTAPNGKALYFSRAPIPYYRDKKMAPQAFQHIGVYGFRKNSLLQFSQLPVSRLEAIEKLENLRMLENNFAVYLSEIQQVGISIDTEEDYERALTYLAQQKL
ncbi:MAG TPA: 3-deoxy-manno-octulosonate cytidylyltransferase [Chitinophagaceae bacterium]|nr:3-deoxy-manno-octulosonate cytidylyltransferase [Chitinophagaceae bacterium]